MQRCAASSNNGVLPRILGEKTILRVTFAKRVSAKKHRSIRCPLSLYRPRERTRSLPNGTAGMFAPEEGTSSFVWRWKRLWKKSALGWNKLPGPKGRTQVRTPGSVSTSLEALFPCWWDSCIIRFQYSWASGVSNLSVGQGPPSDHIHAHQGVTVEAEGSRFQAVLLCNPDPHGHLLWDWYVSSLLPARVPPQTAPWGGGGASSLPF